MNWWLIIIALWLAPAVVLAVILLLSVGRERLSQRKLGKPKSSTRSH